MLDSAKKCCEGQYGHSYTIATKGLGLFSIYLPKISSYKSMKSKSVSMHGTYPVHVLIIEHKYQLFMCYYSQ